MSNTSKFAVTVSFLVNAEDAEDARAHVSRYMARAAQCINTGGYVEPDVVIGEACAADSDDLRSECE